MIRKNIFLTVICLLSILTAGAQTLTPKIGLKIPTTGTLNWFPLVNYNWNLIDQLLGQVSNLQGTPVTTTLPTTGQELYFDGTRLSFRALASVATSGSYVDLVNKPTLATVAASGSYTDLLNKPTIPAAQVSSDWTSGSGVSQILNKPSLATVATSGSYTDLVNKPTLGTTHAPLNSIQVSDGSGGSNSDPALLVNPTTHTLDTSAGNLLVGALSSAPRADFDPMDKQYDGGLAAAIAGTSGFTPTQVINAAIDAGYCSAILNLTPFHSVNIPLPNGVTILITGIKLWGSTSIGGSSPTSGPNLQHNDSSQPMIMAHASGDALVCNGITYHPASSGVGGVFIHDIGIGGMFNPATYTDIGIELNMVSSAAVRIRGFSNRFGASAVLSNGTSTFLSNIGYPGSQVQGCGTFNTGVLSVGGYTAGNGACGAVQDISLDGGAENIYASDGQAAASGNAVGSCYPLCAGFIAAGNETYDTNIFSQVSSVGAIIAGSAVKLGTLRVDYSSREAAIFLSGAIANTITVDSACTDTALSAAYTAGTPSGCNVITEAAGVVGSNLIVGHSGLFPTPYVQCWIADNGGSSSSGSSSVWSNILYQGNPNNATSNDWDICPAGSQPTGVRVNYPSMSSMASTGSTVNVSGISLLRLGSNTVTSIIGGITGQVLTVIGTGTISNTATIINSTGQAASIACGSPDLRTCAQALVYVATSDHNWVQTGGGTTTMTVSSGTAALGTSAVAAAPACNTITAAAAGALTTDSVIWNPNASIKGVTGYVPSASGGLTIAAYLTAGNVNFDVCNWTAAIITPGAITLNWKVVR